MRHVSCLHMYPDLGCLMRIYWIRLAHAIMRHVSCLHMYPDLGCLMRIYCIRLAHAIMRHVSCHCLHMYPDLGCLMRIYCIRLAHAIMRHVSCLDMYPALDCLMRIYCIRLAHAIMNHVSCLDMYPDLGCLMRIYILYQSGSCHHEPCILPTHVSCFGLSLMWIYLMPGWSVWPIHCIVLAWVSRVAWIGSKVHNGHCALSKINVLIFLPKSCVHNTWLVTKLRKTWKHKHVQHGECALIYSTYILLTFFTVY